jgi:hypothetical protein
LALPAKDFLMRHVLFFLAASTLFAEQPKVDNVLVKMVPPGTTALAGAQIQAVIAAPLYAHLVGKQADDFFARFAAETGFDPRRDVRESLFATTPDGSVLLARGHFEPNRKPLENAAVTRHGVYNIWTSQDNGLCILDKTLAAAGKLRVLEAALDEWTAKGSHNAAQPLLVRIKADPAAQVWAVSNGLSALLASGNLPGSGSGLDFATIFRGLTDTWLQVSFATGLKFEAHGVASNLKDAQSLRDAAKGLIGLGRLSVPEDKPELLPVFDGIAVDQQDRAIAIHIDLAQKNVDALVSLLSSRKKQ